MRSETGHAIFIETMRTPTGKRLKIARCTCGWTSPPARHTHTVQKHAAAQHPQSFCPTPDKNRYATRKDAELALLEFWQTMRTGKKELRRAYECECGAWHTTAKPSKPSWAEAPSVSFR